MKRLSISLLVILLLFTLLQAQILAAADYTALFDYTAPAVVMVESGSGSGAGFLVSPAGYVATCSHVLDGDSTVSLAFFNGKEMAGKVIWDNPEMDLALLQVDVMNLPSLRLGNPEALRVGDEVFTVGAPLGLDYSLARGLVSGAKREIEGVEHLQLDVPLNPGNSGGPLLNLQGEVVGICVSMEPEAQGITFAVPVTLLLPALTANRIPVDCTSDLDIAFAAADAPSEPAGRNGSLAPWILVPVILLGAGGWYLYRKRKGPKEAPFEIDLR